MTSPGDLTTLILAPTGRDADLLTKLLRHGGMDTQQVTPEEAVQAVSQQTGAAALIAEEALSAGFIARLGQAIQQQPAWADFPFIILASRGGENEANRRLDQQLLPLLNHTLLERPVRPNTLLSSVRAALRGRKRQYQVRQGIDDLRNASLALEKSEERNRLILQSTRDCIKLLDLDAGLLTMNAEGQERFGITDFSGEIEGRSWLDFWQAPYREAALEAIRTACRGDAGRFEGEFLRKDGDLSWWDVSVTPVRDHEKTITHLLVVSREITGRKLAEKALIESEKLAAVGRLAASISHEINNPLEAVTNLLYILNNDETLSQQGHAYLAMADRELARVSQIAGQTLRFHRQATRPRSITARELLEPVLALYQGRLVNSHITIDFEVRDLPEFTCYEGDIRQVLNNLVGNAVDSMRSRGGRLRIRAQRAHDWTQGRAGARITIADTGHGMPPQVVERIFEAFYTTKGINGNGLGLWISQGIVQKHRGSLRVRSRCARVLNTAEAPGGEPAAVKDDADARSGTVFTLFLPTDLATAS